jgi:hypothetical protein
MTSAKAHHAARKSHRASKVPLAAKPRFQAAVLAAIVVAIVGLGYIVVHSFAAGSGSAQLFLGPATGTYAVGQTINVAVYVNTGGDPVNGVQANLSYPASELQYLSVDDTGSAFSLNAQSTGGSGLVDIARGNPTAVTSTLALVATAHFHVIASGPASITFLNSSVVVRSTDNVNILSILTGANFTLNSAATAAPTTARSAGGVPPTPATVTVGTPASSASVQSTKVLAAAAVGIPVLALLALAGMLTFRHRLPVAPYSGTGQDFTPPPPREPGVPVIVAEPPLDSSQAPLTSTEPKDGQPS